MGKYVCAVCGYIYDEARGVPDSGIAPGAGWEDLPENWNCPLCGAAKSEFRSQNAPAVPGAKNPAPVGTPASDMRELSALEISALCSNLARGCEKQYKSDEAALFSGLAERFKAEAAPFEEASFDRLLARINDDLETGYPGAGAVSSGAADRGALRALVWSEKVTRILKSLLNRYAQEGDAMVENTGVYVCTVCGFVHVGDTPPQICPVCKVPGWKFESVEGR